MSVFKDKTLLITGGTGSFGNAVLNRFLRTDIGETRIFSRDEKKQDDMRHDFQARMPEVANKIKFYIGDVRNKSTLKYAMQDVDYVDGIRSFVNGEWKDRFMPWWEERVS
jgi:UDP-glucose 4-epimerase